MKLEGRVEDKINLLEYSINCKFELTKMQKRTIRELLEEQKDIICLRKSGLLEDIKNLEKI